MFIRTNGFDAATNTDSVRPSDCYGLIMLMEAEWLI